MRLTFRRVDFQFAEKQAIGSRKLHDDVSGRLKAGVLALQFDGLTLRYRTRILATHVVVADLRTVHERMYVRQTDSEVRHVLPCVTAQRHNTIMKHTKIAHSTSNRALWRLMLYLFTVSNSS